VDLSTVISTLSSTAAGWYNGVSTNTPVVVPSPATVAAAGQIAASNQALIQANPVLAGILNSPSLVILIGALIAVLLIWLLTK